MFVFPIFVFTFFLGSEGFIVRFKVAGFFQQSSTYPSHVLRKFTRGCFSHGYLIGSYACFAVFLIGLGVEDFKP